ncbi:MAG: ParB/RepB/Spo0J family partition protein [Patescibacteria group bacterium]
MRRKAVWVPISVIRFSKNAGGVCPKRVEELMMEIEDEKDMEPIRLNALGDGTYVIRDGRHRVRAHIEAGLLEILAFIENTVSKLKSIIRWLFSV